MTTGLPARDSNASDITVSCRIRASMPIEQGATYLKQLRDCERTGRIAGFKVQSWPEEVALSPDRPERAMIRGYESYRDWADQAGVIIEPPFATRTRRSIVTGAEIDVLVLPSVCLALYDDAGGLVGVYPHSDDEGTYTVEEAISRLRDGEVPVPRTGPVRVEGDETCPDCHGLLVPRGGLYGCPDCAWVGYVDPEGNFERVSPEWFGESVDVSVAPGASDEPDDGGNPNPGRDSDDEDDPATTDSFATGGASTGNDSSRKHENENENESEKENESDDEAPLRNH